MSMALMSLAVTSIYSLLTMFLTNSRMINAQADLEDNAQVAVVRMSADLADSKTSTVVIGTAPTGVFFLSPRDGDDRFQRDSSGNLYWQRWVCYYLDTTNKHLVRATIPLGAPTVTPPTSTFTTASFQSQGTRRVVARNITGLTVTGTNPVNLSATFMTSVFRTDDLQISLTDAVNPRN